MVGALLGIMFGYIIRVSIPSEETLAETAYVPPVYPYYPRIMDVTGSYPVYGQVMFAETIGAFIVALIFLHARREIDHGRTDVVTSYFGVALTQFIMCWLFRGVSNGIMNPALAAA